MKNLTGTIIEESLSDASVLDNMRIISTRVEPVTEKHKTPWLQQWTLHSIEIDEGKAREIAEELRESLETEHDAWYADFKNDSTHFIIYADKVFKVDRSKKEEYDEATSHGIALGIPDYQVDFSDFVQKWER